MSRDYLRMKKGIDLGDQNVILFSGDAAPYSQTDTDVVDADLTAAGKGSRYTNRATGDLWLKTSTGGNDVTDWDAVSVGGASSEDSYQNTFIGKTAPGSETPTYSSTNVVTTTNSLETAIGDLDAEIGAAVVAVTRTNNNPISDQAINLNIDALDEAIGNDVVPVTRTNNPIVNSNDIGANLEALDGAIGTDAQISAVSRTAGPITTAQSVNSNIDDLDAAIGADATPVTRTNNPIVAANSVNANIDALDAAIGTDAEIADTTYISQSVTVNANLDSLNDELVLQDGRLDSLETGQLWITKCEWITADNLTAKSGTAAFSDYNGSTAITATDRVWSTFDNKIYVASAGAWGAGTALNSGETAFIEIDCTDTASNEDGGAAYTYNGATSVQVADFDFESADSINLTGGYSAGSGGDTIAASESIESAVQKLDGNQVEIDANVDNLITAVGIAEQATNMGTYTGTIIPDNETAKQNIQSLETDAVALQTAVGIAAEAANMGTYTGTIITDNQTAKQNIQELESEIGAAVTGSNVISDQAVNLNLDAIDSVLGDLDVRTTYTGTPTGQSLDTVTVSDSNTAYDTIEWIVRVHDATNSKKYAVKIFALADVGLAQVDFSESKILRLGTAISGLAFDVTISGSTVTLSVTASVAVEIKTQRITV